MIGRLEIRPPDPEEIFCSTRIHFRCAYPNGLNYLYYASESDMARPGFDRFVIGRFIDEHERREGCRCGDEIRARYGLSGFGDPPEARLQESVEEGPVPLL